MTGVIGWAALILSPWLVLAGIVWLDRRLDELLVARAAEQLCRAAAGGER
jgi:hypothetical protein